MEDLILLNTIESFGYKRLEALLRAFGDTSGILKAGRFELLAVDGIDKVLAEKIAGLDRNKAIKEISLAEKAGVKITSVFDEAYPENLKNIYSPPVILYVKGEIRPEDVDAVAVVGSRRPSYYGLSACERLSEELASRGITVISGLARGIDTAAHRGAVKSGRTIAVLGNGLNGIYPRENKALADKISENGAVISEFPMEVQPNRRNFPKRNRVISGLSLGVLVVEAAEKSGSLITANLALNENKEIFAIPGQIGSVTSAGSNDLIKQGAKLVENTDDILEEIANNLKYAGAGRQNEHSPAGMSDEALTDNEKKIKGLLSHDPVHIDHLAEKGNMSLSQVGSLLLNLELKNIITELPGKSFILNR